MEDNFIDQYKKMFRSLELIDIHLIDLKFKKILDLLPTLLPVTANMVPCKHKYTFRRKEKNLIIKYPIKFTIIDNTGKKTLFEMKSTYKIVYKLDMRVSKDIIDKFITRNVSFNIHPFIRELIHNTLPKVGFPPFTLPLLKNQV